MRFGSVCSGIEAASVAWHPLGWETAFVAEIEPFPCAVLAHHYPTVPNYGDLTRYREWPDACRCDTAGLHELPPPSGPSLARHGASRGSDVYPEQGASPRRGDHTQNCPRCGGADLDVLVGGTPCQSFSVAGLRQGLADPRGNLALVFLGLVDRYRPRWVVWENVPGVLSSSGGRDFGAFLGGLAELGYGWAYRVLDAQYFGVAQRRRRVFVVGYLGDWRRAAAVLFEPESLRGNPPPRREAGERVAGVLKAGARSGGWSNSADHAAAGYMQCAPTIPSRTHAGGGLGTDFDCDGGLIQWPAEIAPTLNAAFGDKQWLEDQHALHGAGCFVPGNVTHSLRADGFDASEDGTGRGTPLVAFDTTQITSAANYSSPKAGDPCHPLASGAHPPAIAFNNRQDPIHGPQSQPLGAKDNGHGVLTSSAVRRLTPRECERLQGFPDDYTLIPYRGKPAADGPRYKALGNSMAVPVMRWIGEQIAAVDAIEAPNGASGGTR